MASLVLNIWRSLNSTRYLQAPTVTTSFLIPVHPPLLPILKIKRSIDFFPSHNLRDYEGRCVYCVADLPYMLLNVTLQQGQEGLVTPVSNMRGKGTPPRNKGTH